MKEKIQPKMCILLIILINFIIFLLRKKCNKKGQLKHVVFTKKKKLKHVVIVPVAGLFASDFVSSFIFCCLPARVVIKSVACHLLYYLSLKVDFTLFFFLSLWCPGFKPHILYILYIISVN